ncbi:MAG TPA: tRNA guanosine(34) transglycosylase Tgt [Deltaproteobacteria bacterium]|nr:tRNA guanosine(34) transglycosylase Tgt [Deltaproteobacteria bacterium]OQC23331.1 MAG: Queuine tRNA-ribosyltransferase [Deltaproteobacteria bacterium ADurb.Bin072]HNQ86832.1 tRNA guanosine(34) transglycosylase Tgt [Deltaproteobacteria bacterium]HNS89405.1 tRNA guanosine(34) transglycosylase Tgt [Deltaproteobacteria bacterium]HOA43738.1 tRNA guanosine(34) transglycosylase Tgt [Deltaproteobacteria bacterium]
MAIQCSSSSYRLSCTDGEARCGMLETRRGPVDTPAFMPVGTAATVKAMTPEQLRHAGARIILGNTYHLHLRPGEELIKALGGLHSFMGWDGPILTDSGGYQVFSLATLVRINDEGVQFASHIDGSRRTLTPEKAIAIQEDLGSDVMMCLDECVAYPSTRDYVEESVARTSMWARRCLEARKSDAALFGIVQGGMEFDLRERSARELTVLPFDGFSIGGLSVGEGHEIMLQVLAETVVHLPVDKPRYLMGVGTPLDIVEAVALGVDMFDCVLPTRNARNGMLFTRHGKMSLKQARFRHDPQPPDDSCACYTCRNFSRAYLRHLYVSGEILSSVLNTIHNLHFYLELMSDIRHSIRERKFTELKKRVKEMFDD